MARSSTTWKPGEQPPGNPKVFKKGNKPTPKMEISALINWIVFRLKGSSIRNVIYQVESSKAFKEFDNYTKMEWNALAVELEFHDRRTKELAEKIANFNKTKTFRKVEDCRPAISQPRSPWAR